MSKIAVIGQIKEIKAIEGADFIQAATVMCGVAGKWSGVVGKDVEVGELVTVFLQDAVLPPNDRWAFMEKHKWRVRMARFKGFPSECLIVKGALEFPIGTDMAEILGVTKYEKPVPASMQGAMVGPFPEFIPKTDEPNFQTVPELVERMVTDEWYVAEKADGSSCTVWNDQDGLHVCSRNWELKEFTPNGGKNAYWQVARKYGMDRLPHGLALQFEVVGPGIQSNPMGYSELEAIAFTLRDTVNHCYLPRLNLERECAALCVPMARLIATGKSSSVPTDEELRKIAEIKYSIGRWGEGVVIRALDSSWSFKVINLHYKD